MVRRLAFFTVLVGVVTVAITVGAFALALGASQERTSTPPAAEDQTPPHLQNRAWEV